MITKPTVLVLGAGASAHLGFPLGPALYASVCEGLDPHLSNNFRQHLNVSQHNPYVLDEFRGSLLKSGVRSVDEFLEYRQEFTDIGKAAMAYVLTRHESEDPLFRPNLTNWYKTVWGYMRGKLDTFADNKISIITFNYDRSFEQFLYVAMSNLHRSDHAATQAILKSFRVLHVHGQLGWLPWQIKPGTHNERRNYNGEWSQPALGVCIKSMRMIHEDAPQSAELLSQIKAWLNEAERIVFLGFSFHPTNVQKLQLDALDDLTGKSLFATGVGLSKTRAEQLRQVYPLKIFDQEIESLLTHEVALT